MGDVECPDCGEHFTENCGDFSNVECPNCGHEFTVLQCNDCKMYIARHGIHTAHDGAWQYCLQCITN